MSKQQSKKYLSMIRKKIRVVEKIDSEYAMEIKKLISFDSKQISEDACLGILEDINQYIRNK